MKFVDIINKINNAAGLTGRYEESITGITYDSRMVQPGSIFVAVKGFNSDGHDYLTAAAVKGAAVLVYENEQKLTPELISNDAIIKLKVADSRKALAEISHVYYGGPSEKLKLIGITGTNGKTTTTYFIKSILKAAGEKSGLIGTIANMIGDVEIPSSLTTPESSDLNKLFLDMYLNGCRYAVMEVSSHSLVLDRVYGLNFAAGIFTNITSDHLDFHNTFESYFAAKKMLFDYLSAEAYGIYNIDDPNGKKLAGNSRSTLVSYGKNKEADIRIENIDYGIEGTSFDIVYGGETYSAFTSLVGEFNAYNASAAFAVTTALGIPAETAVEGIKNTPQVPGRFEVIGTGNKKVIIDYSHTADSLQQALTALNKIVKKERPIYTVFGCGGNRDKTKRPIMGRIAGAMSSRVIVTSDNPRFEDPDEIIAEIAAGIESSNYTVEEGREKAIKKAITESEDNAVILIAGKGHETYQEIKGKRTHFSDKETAEKYLQ